jgi:GNAT superfamily N-acetyltransferase
MGPLIRPFTYSNEDYAAIVAVGNTAYPDHPGTVTEERFFDEHRDPKCKFGRWIAEVAGEVVGVGAFGQHTDMYHPRKFWIQATVRPEHQGQGIGKAMYQHLLAALEPFEPVSLRVGGVREDMLRGRRFLEDRGFREEQRGWESRLDVAAFDPSPYAEVEAKVRERGIQIATMRELAGDPERDRKLYELEMELMADVPQPEPFTAFSFEHYQERQLGDPNLLPDGFFVALHGGAYVGMSNLWRLQSLPDLQVGLTGVKRAYRRQGIAFALKLRSIAYARQRGAPILRTWNEIYNRPMLAINEQLGFVKQPAWIHYVKVLREEPG